MPRGATTQLWFGSQSSLESQRTIVGGVPGIPTLTSQVGLHELLKELKQHTSPSAQVPEPEHSSSAPLQESPSAMQNDGVPRRAQQTVPGSHD
jgi:hypothetical protein